MFVSRSLALIEVECPSRNHLKIVFHLNVMYDHLYKRNRKKYSKLSDTENFLEYSYSIKLVIKYRCYNSVIEINHD